MMNKTKIKFLLLAMAVAVLFTACKTNIEQNIESTETNRLVRIYPTVSIDARTVMPVYSSVDLANMKYKVTCGYMDGTWSESTPSTNSYSSYMTYETLSQGVLVPEGNIYIELEAVYQSSYVDFIGRAENIAVTYGEEIDVSVILHPVKYSGYQGTIPLDLTFNFPSGTNPKYVSGYIRCYYSDGSEYSNYSNSISNSTSNVKTSTIEVAETETEEAYSYPQMKITYSKYMYSTCNYFVEFTFHDVETVDGNEVIKGIYKHKSAIIQPYSSSTVYETVTLESFPKAYTITYHIPGSTNVVNYYASNYGYSLYDPTTYTWYTDEACTQKATDKGPGKASGNIDLYSSARTNFHTISFKDTEGNLVKMKTTDEVPEELEYVSVPNGKYSYLLCGDSEGVRLNNIDYNISKEGCYIKGIYKDHEKANVICSETNGSSDGIRLDSDTIFYVEYAPIVTLKVVDRADAETVLLEMKLYNNQYYLGTNYVSTRIGSSKCYSNDYSKLVYKYYSSATDDDTVILKDRNIYVTENQNIIYAELDVPHKITVIDITAEDKESDDAILAETNFCMRNVKLYEDKISTDYYKDTYFTGYMACFYLDPQGENPIEPGYSFTDLNEDITIYAVKRKTKTFTLTYNRAYKLIVNDENTKIIKADGWYKDADGNNFWIYYNYINTSNTRNNTYTCTVYLGPVDPLQNYSGDVEVVELVPEGTALIPDFGHETEESTVIQSSDALWFVYGYSLIKDAKYKLYWNDTTDCMIYIVNPNTGSCIVSIDGDTTKSFTVSSTDIYYVYVTRYDSSGRLDCEFHLYEEPAGVSAVSFDVKGDVSVTKSTPDEDGNITLSASDNFVTYEWKLGNKVIGNEQTFVIVPSTEENPTDFKAGETYQINLKCNNILSSRILITIPVEEGSDE